MITAENLTKQYGATRALDNVTFTIESGESVAFWGDNGAGKTTALRCILGVHAFDGQLAVNGVNVRRHGKQARSLIGYVPQEAVFHDMPVHETLVFYARLKKAPPESIPQLLAHVQLTEHRAKSVHALSGGMKQRLALAIALLSDPPVLILDEPTTNLDTSARRDFLQMVQTANQAGKTIVFSSHRLEEVTALAHRVLVLNQGALALSCAPDELPGKLGLRQWIRIIVSPPQREDAITQFRFHNIPFVPNGRAIYARIQPGNKMTPLRLLEAARIPVQDFDVVESSDVVPSQDENHD